MVGRPPKEEKDDSYEGLALSLMRDQLKGLERRLSQSEAVLEQVIGFINGLQKVEEKPISNSNEVTPRINDSPSIHDGVSSQPVKRGLFGFKK